MFSEPEKPCTILVIDDDPSVLNVLRRRLARWNFKVLTAGNGQEGLAIFRQERPDVVITDLIMPGMDGLGVLNSLSQNTKEIPVIILSGQGELGDVIRALRMGAWDYICKPIEDMSFLRFSIDRVLEKARLISENQRHRQHLEALVAEKTADLVESENRYRTVADFTYDWESWVDPEGRMLYVSPSCERITGYTPEEFTFNPGLLEDIIYPDDRLAFDQHLEVDKALAETGGIDFRIVRRDGQIRWIGHCCQVVRTADGRNLGRRSGNRDITYQKEIEHRLIQQKNDLINQTIKLEHANIALQKANEALKTLLDQREVEKRSIEQTMVANLKRYVYPYLDDLAPRKTDKDMTMHSATLAIIRTNIDQLVSPVSKSLSGAYLSFTPTEIKVADLIRQGASTQAIADRLNTSIGTVAIHRSNIRKKLNITKKKVNLLTYLNSLA